MLARETRPDTAETACLPVGQLREPTLAPDFLDFLERYASNLEMAQRWLEGVHHFLSDRLLNGAASAGRESVAEVADSPVLLRIVPFDQPERSCLIGIDDLKQLPHELFAGRIWKSGPVLLESRALAEGTLELRLTTHFLADVPADETACQQSYDCLIFAVAEIPSGTIKPKLVSYTVYL
ncbi:MAG TPA: hypothetical protein VFA81_04645, partial [Burkholderiales bacterium]|nr:hypothetical protein [Burkholderiales bacterium]